MGLVGVLCDDPLHEGETFTFSECLACARSGGPRHCHNTIGNLMLMARNQDDRKDAGLSVTSLLDCPRYVAMTRIYDYCEHPVDFWPRARGTLGHLLMEYDNDPNAIAEVRIRKSVPVDGELFEITGKSDKVYPSRSLIVDFKSIGRISKVRSKPKSGHEEQVNFYKYLWWGGTRLDTNEQVWVEITKGGIHYFDLNEQLKHSVRIWEMDDIENLIVDRLRPHLAWRKTGELPACNPYVPTYGRYPCSCEKLEMQLRERGVWK